MQRIRKILIANRGEIACRILRTCSSMGIATVAVYSDADRNAAFVTMADEALRIGPAPSAESYLCADRIIAAAKRSGADAIHPGYGFLAENAAFAEACCAADITFIGPSPTAIALLGSKKASKALVAKAGVPIVPSYDEEDRAAIVYPILLKASAGGGGKGMQVVSEASELDEALASTRRVAQSAFGDSTILLEAYIESPRHIEIQILGDQHGSLVHLFERECSIQRRHQKIIEESPAPNLDPALRDEIAAAALLVGKAANYHNAGTVEFIVTPGGEFYFLEVNTRLQVEHPVTEEVTGIDLVREQIRIAQGEPLGYSQADLQQRGAAIEVRLYAEDCDNAFLPSSGTLLDWHVPTLPGLRVESGVDVGSEISIHYDPMIAKLVTHAENRSGAIAKMLRVLHGLSAAGVTTNRRYLHSILAHADFSDGAIATDFLERHKQALCAPEPAQADVYTAALAVCTLLCNQSIEQRRVLPHITPGFRNSRWREERVSFKHGDVAFAVGYKFVRDGSLHMRVPTPGEGLQATLASDASWLHVRWISQAGVALVLEIDGYSRHFRITSKDDRHLVFVGGQEFVLRQQPRFPARGTLGVEGGCIAPMPGHVIKIHVQNGDSVQAGDTLLILEAMKMEHRIKADRDGKVSALSVAEGDQVQAEQLLAVVSSDELR